MTPTPLRTIIVALMAAGVLASQGSLTIRNSSVLPAGVVGTSYDNGGLTLAVQGGSAPFTWSSTGTLPPGLTLYSFGAISGIPLSAGQYPFTLTVKDSSGLSASGSFSIAITGPAFSITTTSPLPAGMVGQSYTPLTLTTTGGAAPLTWAVGAGLAPGLSVSQTGVISGTPTTAGAFSFTVQATDSAQKTATANLSITIAAPPLTIITVPPLFDGTVGQTYSQTFTASGGKPPYNWAVVGALPAGLTLDSATGIVTGTPASAGTSTFTVQVTDSASAVAQQNFSINVNPPLLTLIAVSALPSGTVGASYSQKLPLTASGGTPPYTWSITSGSAPGLNLNSTSAILSGTPSSPGTFNLAVQVSDSAGHNASKTLALTIAAAVLSITTSRQLPDAAINQPYSQTISATGGVPPYSWSGTGLPTGLALDPSTGILSGTPSAAGTFAIAVTVQDTTLAKFSDRFTLNVAFPSAPAVTLSGLPNPALPAQQYTLGVALANPYPADISGQLLLTFSPDTGPADQTIQFASGGTTTSFTVAQGSTTAVANTPLAIQTGTVSGTLTILVRLQAGGVDITPSPAPSVTAQIAAAGPVISGLQFKVTGNTLSVTVTGYATSRQITQAVFNFAAAAGQTLQPVASSISVDVSGLFGAWFQSSASAQFGTQFIFTQPFTIQGDPTAVIPVSVTLVNPIGQTTAKF